MVLAYFMKFSPAVAISLAKPAVFGRSNSNSNFAIPASLPPFPLTAVRAGVRGKRANKSVALCLGWNLPIFNEKWYQTSFRLV